jgi:hypothetical protein
MHPFLIVDVLGRVENSLVDVEGVFVEATEDIKSNFADRIDSKHDKYQ